MDNYEINTNTVAILPYEKKNSFIIEEEDSFIINKTPLEIIDHSCKFFGSSYEGRHVGTKNMIGISYKTPILIEEKQNIIFFPTMSSKDSDCYWISLNKIEKYSKKNDKSTILFKNGQEISINISLGSLQNQIFRAAMLDSVIRKRQKIS